MKKYVQNERGLTLIELLATIVIGSIVIGLATSVFVSAAKQNKITYEHNALRQEANLIITKLRQIHQEPDSNQGLYSYSLCYESNEKIYLDTTLTNSLGNENYTFKNVEFVNAIENPNSYKTIDSANDCITNVDIYSPLLVKFTLVNQQGQEFDMNTAIARITPLEEVIREWKENEDEPVEPEAPGKPQPDEENTKFEEISNDNFRNYEELSNGDLNSCKYVNTNNNYKVTGTLEYPPNNGGHCNSFPKSLYVSKLELSSGSLNIMETFYNDGKTEVKGNSTLNVLSNARLSGDLELKNGASLIIGNKLQAAKATLEANADIYVGDSGKFTSDLTLKDNTELYVENNLFAQKTTVGNGARIIVGNSAVFDKTITLDNGSICVEGNVSFGFKPEPIVVQADSCTNPSKNSITVVKKP
ncbi:prepilin-type N-terminal cleavage/methylation domain-containing protein [Bacillus sp. RO1]|uniref:PulJ/GspJ family protein n=1 Tax=Bacillus sp. RO1 TaxID=2722703 RepID=UPI0014572A54|nr:prepilin-type N-terminal cleavage/methylation domain-containing protein [Bacillus sp. RO1]NLP50316.1 prepilin-type N-terminal cleavage/methylation domain-containing protein [Bacillus sp. RO1]